MTPVAVGDTVSVIVGGKLIIGRLEDVLDDGEVFVVGPWHVQVSQIGAMAVGEHHPAEDWVIEI